MFTAKIKSTDTSEGVIKIFVDFTDGEKTFTEWCIPQNQAGFDHWVLSRIEAMNTAKTLADKFTVGADIVIEQPVVVEPNEEEVVFLTWVANNRALKNAEELVERSEKHGLAVDPLLLEQIKTLAETVNSTFKPEYIRKI
jgi:hypothetical protein